MTNPHSRVELRRPPRWRLILSDPITPLWLVVGLAAALLAVVAS